MGRADSPLRDHVLFINGAPRSGTTWLVSLLAMHPDIAGVQAESHLFDFGVDRLFDNWEARDPTASGLLNYVGRERLVDLVRELCDGILEDMRVNVSGATEPQFVVEKTPVGTRQDGLDLERKLEIYPDGWFLHIVRGREAVVRSLMRAPFMGNRTREHCEQFYDRIIGDIRRVYGEQPRYRELSYEDLRSDPAEACRGVFAWLGVDASDDALRVIRAISHEKVSEMGAVAPAEPARVGIRTRARRALRRRGASPAPDRLESMVVWKFNGAMYLRNIEGLRELVHPKLEWIYRGPEGDQWLEGEEAIQALIDLTNTVYGRGYTGGWLGSGGGGPGEFWTSEPGRPFCSVFMSGLAGDGTRVDLAFGLVLEGQLIRRIVVVSGGPPSGRPVVSS